MRKLMGFAAFLAAFTIPAFAQDQTADRTTTTGATTSARAATGTDDDDADKSARVRIINGTTQALRATIGGTAVGSDIQAGGASTWQTITGKDQKLQLTTADGTAIGDEKEIDVDDDNHDYIVVVVPGDEAGDKPEVKTHRAARTKTLDNNKARVTLINASNAVPAADLLVGEDKVHAGVNPGGKNGPDEVDLSKGSIKVQNGRTKSEIRLDNSTLSPGQDYLVVVTGPSQATLLDETGGGSTGGRQPSPGAGSATPAAATFGSTTATTGTGGNP